MYNMNTKIIILVCIIQEASAEVDEGADRRNVLHSGDSVASGSAQQEEDKNSQEMEGAPAKKLPRCPYGKTCYRSASIDDLV